MLLASAARLYGVLKQKVYEARQKRSSHWPVVEHKHLQQHPSCAVCGKRQHIQVHHIIPFHSHPELELDPANLITLCMGLKQCHLKIGHGGSFKMYNPHVVGDAMKLRQQPELWNTYVKAAFDTRKPNV
jgi:5-methylcytosine-specific restriction protein A